jgi:protein-disulfide isomerase
MIERAEIMPLTGRRRECLAVALILLLTTACDLTGDAVETEPSQRPAPAASPGRDPTVAPPVMTTEGRPELSSGEFTALIAGISRDGLRLGDVEAPLTVTVYGDFQCQPCRTFNLAVLPDLVAEFVATGQVRLVYIPVEAFRGRESLWAAQAAHCAAAQNLFWEYQAGLFEKQGPLNSGVYRKPALSAAASALELDPASFNSCLAGDDFLDRVRIDTNFARQDGLATVPTVVIEGRFYGGLPDSPTLRQRIQSALSAAAAD